MSASELPTSARSGARTRVGGAQGRAGGAQALVLDRYRLHRRIGAGAFGTVWLARDERLDREVAIKIVPRERIIGGRFEREARAAARLAHPGIVTLYEATVDDEDAYLVSELVRGTTLDQLLEDGRLSDRDIVRIGIALCDALGHAHAQGIIHRDIKPANVLVPRQPATSAQIAKLTDFGVARVIGGDSLTRTGDVIGTAAYMAPEQAEGRPAAESADLYSLALVLYEALAGVNPVRTNTAAQRARRLGAHLPPLRRQRRDLPPELAQGIDLALRPRPRERGSLEELRTALSAALPHVEDRPGIVANAWPTGIRRATDEALAEPPHRLGEPPHPLGEDQQEPRDDAQSPKPRLGWRPRAAMALATAILAAWLTRHLLDPSPLAPAAAGIIAAAITLVLPRIGWLGLTAAFGVAAIAQDHPGAALVLMLCALVPVALMLRAPALWPVSGAAPALGVLGLAGAWPALAARASTPLRRAGLGATGWVWLVAVQALTGRRLYIGHVPGLLDPRAWGSVPYDTIHHVLGPLITSGVLAPAAIWAGAALTLPWVVRGRSLPVDLVLAIAWAATVASSTTTVLKAVGATGALPTADLVVIGAIGAALIALAPAAAAVWRSRSEGGGPRGVRSVGGLA